VNPGRGDRIHYRHINRPRFDIGRWKIEFDLHTYNWQLNIMKRLKLLRRLLPQWHRAEKDFRDWYLHLAARFHPRTAEEYGNWLEILRCPAKVTGYRHIRHPRQETARREAEAALARLNQEAGSSKLEAGRRKQEAQEA
jgi:indolepyruvate ferredoxin oxidoreductase